MARQFAPGASQVLPFGGGHINSTFLVDSADGPLVLQRLNERVFAKPELVMQNILRLHRHVGPDLVPEPVPTTQGQWLVRRGRSVWRAWRRVADADPIESPTPPLARSAATLLGRLHAAVADLDPSTMAVPLPGFHDPAGRLRALVAIVAADPCDRARSVGAEVAAIGAASFLAGVADDLGRAVQVRVAHNDAKLDNVLFRGAEAVTIVDLDTVMPGPWFWDVGDLLRSASTRAPEDTPDAGRSVVDPALFRAILDGYREGAAGAVTWSELDALEFCGAVTTFEQATRFLTDWIGGDVYYRTTRPGQNLDRVRAQLHLLQSMLDLAGAA